MRADPDRAAELLAVTGALAALDAAKVTTARYRLFGRSLAQPRGPARRWLERRTGRWIHRPTPS